MTALEINDGRNAPVRAGGVVLTHGNGQVGHQSSTQRLIAARIAALLNMPFAGPCETASRYASCYLVPRNCLSGSRIAGQCSIQDESDLFGGWTRRSWMATKAIMHPLVDGNAQAPPRWPQMLGEEARAVTLRGITAFSAQDARKAGLTLLRTGPIRLKNVCADGGRGQHIVRNQNELETLLNALCSDGHLPDPLVMEENLEDVTTFSVGQVRLKGRTISYCGTQSLTTNNHGGSAYGGSDLLVVRGGYDHLLSRPLSPAFRQAIEHAISFDTLADRHIEGLIASRRNYDVASGVASDGSRRMGVLEQSWRMGGATGAEIAALEAFANNPELATVRACTVETYGADCVIPPGATVYFQGDDPTLGPFTKYAYAEASGEGN